MMIYAWSSRLGENQSIVGLPSFDSRSAMMAHWQNELVLLGIVGSWADSSFWCALFPFLVCKLSIVVCKGESHSDVQAPSLVRKLIILVCKLSVVVCKLHNLVRKLPFAFHFKCVVFSSYCLSTRRPTDTTKKYRCLL